MGMSKSGQKKPKGTQTRRSKNPNNKPAGNQSVEPALASAETVSVAADAVVTAADTVSAPADAVLAPADTVLAPAAAIWASAETVSAPMASVRERALVSAASASIAAPAQ